MITQMGTWSEIPSAYLTNVIAKSGMDFVILDMEHSVFGFETLQNCIFAGHCEAMNVYVRIPALEESYVKRALDAGADGIVFHQLKSIGDVKKAVEISKFFPQGCRGFNPYTPACGYQPVKQDFLEEQNRSGKNIIILENKEIFEDLIAISRIPGVDVLYIGQYDLSIAFGIPGEVNHPVILKCINDTIKAAREAKKQVGCMVHSVNDAKKMIEAGVSFLVFKTDTAVIYTAYNQMKQEVQKDEII